MGWALFGDPGTAGLLVGLFGGAIVIFVGITIASPTFSSPVLRTIGAPLRFVPWLKVSGRLARENSARSVRTTSAAAASLMIGLALIAMAGVFGESLKRTISDTLESSLQADFFIQEDGFGEGFGADLAESVRASDEFDQVAAFRFGNIRVENDIKDVFATNFDQLDGLIDPDVISGSLTDADTSSILLHEDPAADLGVGPGDPITVDFASGESTVLTVAAVY